jgi:hydroxypyruvate reductase
MNSLLRSHADAIVAASIREVLPDSAVQKALEGKAFPGRVILIAAGKAAWQMAKAAYDTLGERIHAGAVVTKYNHVKGPIGRFILCEGGHPVPDENSFAGTRQALRLTEGLTENDTVLFLLSGGGSALFEDPLVSGEEL